MRDVDDQRGRNEDAGQVLVKPMKRCDGFTLIELLAAVTVMAIMMSFAVPGMSALLESQRLRSATFDLVADLTLARNESLKRSAAVTLAPLSGSDWSSGWRVRVGANDAVLRERPSVGGTVKVSKAPGTVAFDRNGRLAGAGGVVRVQLDSSVIALESHARCVTIDMLGRARSDAGTCR